MQLMYEAVRDYRRKMLWVVTCRNATEEEREQARDDVRVANEVLQALDGERDD